jgi:hypothetical protein
MEVTMQVRNTPVSTQKQCEKEKAKSRGKPFEKGHQYAFKPGQSGNPGGLPKGTPKVSVALMKLLRSDPDEVFKPKSRAEQIAFALFQKAVTGDVSVIKELSDRTEGKSPATMNVNAGDKAHAYRSLAEKLAAQYEKPLEEVVCDIIEREPSAVVYFQDWLM